MENKLNSEFPALGDGGEAGLADCVGEGNGSNSSEISSGLQATWFPCWYLIAPISIQSILNMDGEIKGIPRFRFQDVDILVAEEELQAKSFGKELSRQEFDSLLVSWTFFRLLEAVGIGKAQKLWSLMWFDIVRYKLYFSRDYHLT